LDSGHVASITDDIRRRMIIAAEEGMAAYGFLGRKFDLESAMSHGFMRDCEHLIGAAFNIWDERHMDEDDEGDGDPILLPVEKRAA
jgi:hypothetical protein